MFVQCFCLYMGGVGRVNVVVALDQFFYQFFILNIFPLHS